MAGLRGPSESVDNDPRTRAGRHRSDARGDLVLSARSSRAVVEGQRRPLPEALENLEFAGAERQPRSTEASRGTHDWPWTPADADHRATREPFGYRVGTCRNRTTTAAGLPDRAPPDAAAEMIDEVLDEHAKAARIKLIVLVVDDVHVAVGVRRGRPRRTMFPSDRSGRSGHQRDGGLVEGGRYASAVKSPGGEHRMRRRDR